ncbi:MAG: alpha/beta fold hydrolase [Candidatus Caldatribacterium sp.]|nr:alpha/beta fold hydrolase [Candidatus Caldatribacterium sp.]
MTGKIGILLALAFLFFLSPKAFGKSESLALTYLEKIKGGLYEEAWAMEDATMQSLLSPKALKDMWEGMTRDLGGFKGLALQRVEERDPYTLVFIVSSFERATLLAQVTVDKSGKIAGLFFLPYTFSEYSPPPYAPQEFVEREVVFGRPPFELPGTLTLPKGEGPFPCVLLVHGSGPNDRDETVGACKPFRDLALGLAGKGIAVFRYDKRTYVHAQEIGKILPRFTVEEEVIEDALEALEFLRKIPEIDPERVFLLGHSLGGWLAPEIALRDGKVRGVILLAAPARPLHELVPEQAEYLFRRDGKLEAREVQELQEIQKIVELLRTRALKEDEPVPYLGGYARYHYSLMDLKPLESARKLSCPILVVQGGRDYQVREKDFLLWKEALRAHPRASFKLYPACNHLFVPGEGPSVPEEYAKPGHVDAGLIEDLARWIQKWCSQG